MEIQLSSIIIQLINFGLVVFIIAKFIYKPIIKILKQRTEKIEQSQLEVEKISKKTQELDATSKTTILEAKKEANQILSDAKKQAEKEAASILSKAKADAKKLSETERKDLLASIENEKKSILANLSKLVTSTTSQVLVDALTPEDQERIINSQINTIKGASLE